MFRLSLAALTLVLSTGCGGSTATRLAIYDWEAQRATASTDDSRLLVCQRAACPDPHAKRIYVVGAPKLTGDDLDPDSVRAEVDPQVGAPIVVAQLTDGGRERFEALTRRLAERGAKRHAPQHFLVVVDDVVRASPFIDYEAFPSGVDSSDGIQISGLASVKEAKELAKALRKQ
jgi:preprotein translocase subunit SecD